MIHHAVHAVFIIKNDATDDLDYSAKLRLVHHGSCVCRRGILNLKSRVSARPCVLLSNEHHSTPVAPSSSASPSASLLLPLVTTLLHLPTMASHQTITQEPKIRGNEFESSHPHGLDVGPDTDVISKIETFNVVCI
jgi:hypothetical protein